jgi:hypothetical protein
MSEGRESLGGVQMPKTQWLQRSVVVILMGGQLSGCTSWRLETVSPADIIAREEPSEIRVQYADRHHEVLYEPEVRGDSLLGRPQRNARRPARAVALTDVKGVATRRVSAGRTTALALGIVGIGAVVGLMIGIATMQGPLDNWGQ